MAFVVHACVFATHRFALHVLDLTTRRMALFWPALPPHPPTIWTHKCTMFLLTNSLLEHMFLFTLYNLLYRYRIILCYHCKIPQPILL